MPYPLKNQVNNLQNQVDELTGSVNELEQYGRRDCLEIQGISVAQGENTNEIPRSVENLINVDVRKKDASISHQSTSNNCQICEAYDKRCCKFIMAERIFEIKPPPMLGCEECPTIKYISQKV